MTTYWIGKLPDTDGMTDYGGEDGTVYFCDDCEIKEVQPL